MKNTLLLSLGHNSSAIHTHRDGLIGYETERLDRIKSSSNSPILAIEQINKFQPIPYQTPIFVTHWFDYYGEFPKTRYSEKIFEYARATSSTVYTHSADFTHHDAHAWSAKSFFRHHIKPEHTKYGQTEPVYFIVADGFGNYQETISIYAMEYNSGKLFCIKKAYGYELSLGLMYQYATFFCGMKMNQDEYKFLGYESKIQEFLADFEITNLHCQAVDRAAKLLHDIINSREETIHSPDSVKSLISYGYLEKVKEMWLDQFLMVIKDFGEDNPECMKSRVIIAYYIQTIIEQVMCDLVTNWGMKNVVLSGGIFYNVKLNNRILKHIPGLFSVVPLAGDQGASIGFYEKFVGEFNWSTLAIGKRDFSSAKLGIMQSVPKVHVPKSEDECVNLIYSKISSGEIVNLVTDTMEFGPRALGHTSSLFLPTRLLSQTNNKLNERNEVMPFAPMILEESRVNYFDDSYKRVVGSDKFMIVTYDYTQPINVKNEGVYHHYPLGDKCSGRPQVVSQKDNLLIYKTMFNMWVGHHQALLTNTSYNYHGEPIVYSLDDILKTHYKQLNNAEKLSVKINLVLYNQTRDTKAI